MTRTSTGSAIARTLATLLIFVAVFVSFLIAPLLVLLVAFLAYTAMRHRGGSSTQTPAAAPAAPLAPGATPLPASGFGSGARA
ncbi:hypothetical protein [Nocardioides sp. zg-DK7169]|uniref:hypothetical protein n=1 Tax=Nocardioides sp. zg-DK7169 TaxID=2736600 RepID=UPI0015582A6F|nr:hypothetical protein [Nocardioides sp. zg-DK7169]NPC98473.1 hypothetical protein [Nocardioides sp. zg-DK7169]